MRTNTRIVSLESALADLVEDGATVALEGFTHLIPFAAGQELIRQGRRDLTVVRLTPDLIYDQLIGAGCVRRLVFSWGGNPGVGSLHRLRDAVENDWPAPLELDEHSHAGLANRYVAAAAGLPFVVMRGYRGTDLEGRSENIAPIACPFTGELLTAVSAVQLDVGIVHAQQADRRGNVQMWGLTGVQKETVLGAARSLVTVEEVVDELVPRPDAVILPNWTVDLVAEVPGGARPSYAHDYYDRDNDRYREWDAISRDRERFRAWVEEEVVGGASAA
jgi:glutaconate CoA-transferase, subunit A